MIPLEDPSTNFTCNIAEHYQLYEKPLKDSTFRDSLRKNGSMITSRSSSVSSANLSSLSLASTSSSETFQIVPARTLSFPLTTFTVNNCTEHSPQPSSLVVLSRKRAFENLSAMVLTDVQPDDECSRTYRPPVTMSTAVFPSYDATDD
jgi:hypothetical protein